MVCAPGVAHSRLTRPTATNCCSTTCCGSRTPSATTSTFMMKMRDRGIEVVEMHNLLAETVAVPEAEVDPRQPGRARPGGPGFHRRAAQLPGGPRQPQARRDADRRPVDARLSRGARRRRAQVVKEAAGATEYLLPPLPNTPVHARHDVLDLRRRDAEPAVLARAGTRRRSSPRRSTSSIRTSPARSTSGGATRPRTTASRRWKARRHAHRQGQRADRHERAHVAAGDQPARGDALCQAGRRAGDRRRDAEDPRGDAPRHRVHVRRPRLRAARAGLPRQDHHLLVRPSSHPSGVELHAEKKPFVEVVREALG